MPHFKDVLDNKSSPHPGIDPGVRCHGMKTKPTGILCSKYEFFLINGYQDSHLMIKLNYYILTVS